MNQYNSEALKKGKRSLPEDVVLLSICEQYGWSREQIMQTPQYLIEVIIKKNNTDFKIMKMKNGK